MGITERRYKILRALCRRGYDTIGNLAAELGVSERTIQRDISTLSETAPIYTQSGRYGGGVYAMDTLRMDRMYMAENELSVLRKVLQFSNARAPCLLDANEQQILASVIKEYSESS